MEFGSLLVNGPPIEGIQKKDLEGLYTAALPNLIDADPERAMNLIRSDQATKYSYPVLSNALRKVYRDAPVQANNRVTTRLHELDPATAQRIIVGLGQVALENDEFDTAKNGMLPRVPPVANSREPTG